LTFQGDTFQTVDADTLLFYRQGIEWSAEAEAVHGLSREFLSQFETQYSENVRRLFKVVWRGNLIGQNLVNFDLKVIRRFLNNLDYPPIEVQNTYDTMNVLGRKAKLGVIFETLGLSDMMAKIICKGLFSKTPLGGTEGYHSSEYDVVATYMIFQNARKNKMI
jgi:DNA polymerase III epsilon subunit-like protein